MTANGVNEDEMRKQLVTALHGHPGTLLDIHCGRFDPDAVVDALLPYVVGQMRRYAAMHLRDAASDLRDLQAKAVVRASQTVAGQRAQFAKNVGRSVGFGVAAYHLCARADELDARLEQVRRDSRADVKAEEGTA